MRTFFLFLLLAGCGYKFIDNNKKISVEYANSDEKGLFTKELVDQLTSFGFWVSNNADITLKVSLEDIADNAIGYRFDRENDGSLKKNLMATENRKKIKAKVLLMSGSKVIWGPEIISASVDYDYVTQDSIKDLSFVLPSSNRTSVLSFSLGQLESIDSASNAALTSLYKILSKKIVRTIETR